MRKLCPFSVQRGLVRAGERRESGLNGVDGVAEVLLGLEEGLVLLVALVDRLRRASAHATRPESVSFPNAIRTSSLVSAELGGSHAKRR